MREGDPRPLSGGPARTTAWRGPCPEREEDRAHARGPLVQSDDVSSRLTGRGAPPGALRTEAWTKGLPRSGALLVALLGAACNDESSTCAGVTPAGLVVAVVDAETGEPLCDAAVHLDHASHAEDLVADAVDPCRYIGGREAGTYTITVTREGYAPGTAEVVVEEDGTCTGLATRELELELVPES